MTALELGLAAVIVGLIIGILILRRSARDRADGLFQAWRAEEGRHIGAAAADAARLTVKAALTGPLPSLAADGRWIGDPVHLVVFDGDSEVKAGALDELRAITFVADLGTCPEADLVGECVAAGRVRWVTLRVPSDPD